MGKLRKAKPYRDRKPFCRKRGSGMAFRFRGDYTAGMPQAPKHAGFNPIGFMKALAAAMTAKGTQGHGER